MSFGRRSVVSIFAVLALLLSMAGLTVAGTPAGHAAESASGPKPHALGKVYRPHVHGPDRKHLGDFSARPDPAEQALVRAQAQAAASGKPVTAGSLTTGTNTVTVSPRGLVTERGNVLPVRVRRGQGWVPVSTGLRTVAGRLSPGAIPGDSVSFSPGGTGAMAVISVGTSRLSLWWPGPLPVPSVSGPSATYRNVKPGVDLVLTATSEATGGFKEVLVVGSAQAAAALGSVSLRVTTQGARLTGTPSGGLVVPLSGGHGYFVAPPSQMWGTPGTAASVRTERLPAAVRAAGGSLAPPWSPPVSGPWGPGRGALTGQVAAQVLAGGTRLRLVPNRSLLTSPMMHYPLYIDPMLWLDQSGGGSTKAYDPVQSESDCQDPHYNSSSYSDSPVGYDNFQAGTCQFSDSDRALYTVGLHQVIEDSGIHLESAQFNVAVAYSSSCSASSTDTLSWIRGIDKGTGWPGPNKEVNDTDVTATFQPDSAANNGTGTDSCSNTFVENDGATIAGSFNVMADMQNITGSTFTVRIWQPASESNGPSDSSYENFHEQFANNPVLVVNFFFTPNTPSTSTMQESSTSGGNPKDCGTTIASAPVLQATAANHGVYLRAVLSDPDNGQTDLTGNIHYWQNGNSANGANQQYAGTGWFNIPWSYVSGLSNGDVIVWTVQATTPSRTLLGKQWGPYTSSWSAQCYFKIYNSAVPGPTVTTNFAQGTAQPVGHTITFGISQPTGYTAAYFVWGLDGAAPTGTQTWTPPPSQSCSTSGATSSCTKIVSGAATLSIVVPSPGPHVLNVYQIDADGTISETSQDLYVPTGGQATNYTFTGAGDPSTRWFSESTLDGNLSDAFDNTLVSGIDASGNPETCLPSGGDGGGSYIDAPELIAAGWGTRAGNKEVTIDGAGFLTPPLGSCDADNALSANQILGAGNAYGNAIVFLATSTNGDVNVPGLMTGAPDPTSPLQSDYTAPAVPGGANVTGSGCLASQSFGVPCSPATGQINYGTAAGVTCPQSASFTLTVPDWVTGPSDIQATGVGDWINANGVKAKAPQIYAFAVPLDASCPVASVELPDVSGTVQANPASSVGVILPALHIFGASVRNTTTSTPPVQFGLTATNPGQAWTGAFESPVEDAFAAPPGYSWGSQTIRIEASVNTSALAGQQIRIRLSDPGFLSADGTSPIMIGAATIANDFGGPVPAATPVPLTFAGGPSVSVPEGGEIYSDPLTLPFNVTAGKSMLISLWMKNTGPPFLPINSMGSGALAWFASPSTPNETGDTSGTPFTGSGSTFISGVPILTGIDVTTSAVTMNGPNGLATSPGAPTIVVAGDNVIDGWTASPLSDALNVPSNRIAGQLASQGLVTGFGTVDAGIASNQLLTDTSPGGVSLAARLDRDILAEPDVGTVIIDQGLEDALQSASDRSACVPNSTVCPIIDAYVALVDQLFAFGINVIVANLTPCSGYTNTSAGDSCHGTESPPMEPTRGFINDQITGQQLTVDPYCLADFEGAVGNTASPMAIKPADATSDKANLSWVGYAALTGAVPLSNICLGPSQFPLPSN